MGLFGKKHGDTERAYRDAADKFNAEWVSSGVTGNDRTPGDEIQSAIPDHMITEEDK